MKIQGTIHKVGKFWAVEIPTLVLNTQGRTKHEAYEMAKDAVESLIDTKGFKVEIEPTEGNHFLVSANNVGLILAAALRQLRALAGLSIRAVAQKLGSDSPNAYGKYETGRTVPSFETFTKLVRVLDNSVEPVITLERRHG